MMPADSPTGPTRVLLRAVLRLAQMVRDAWVIAGITLLLFLALEVAYRTQASVRTALRPASTRAADSSAHPYAGETWWPAFAGPSGRGGLAYSWDAYRNWRLAFYHRPGITIDSSGVRLTVPSPAAGPDTLRVVMLGGSATWGYTARDSFTIPSWTARRLHQLGLPNAEVVSLASPGYQSTQEAVTLLLNLARGLRPAVVVSYDGYNDIEASSREGIGEVINATRTQQILRRGNRRLSKELIGLSRHSELVQRLTPGPVPPVRVRNVDAFCDSLARYYEGVSQEIELLAAGHGAPVFFFFQAMDASSGKRRSRWEATFPQDSLRLGLFTRCTEKVDSAMGARRGVSYYSLQRFFDGDTATVFVDPFSHLTEDGNRRVGEYIADVIAPMLRRARSTTSRR